MKTIVVKQLDKKDKEIANILISLGIRKNMARELAYLQNVYEATTAEIEKGTGMKQSDISLVMKELRKRDWIREREEGIPGKGMPPKIISLKIGFDEIIALLEKQQKRKVNEIQSKIERLKDITRS